MDVDLNSSYEGLTLNHINNYIHILTVCDPVMGDNGRYYVPQELLPVYKEVIVPLADVLTPNAFELGELTNSKITTIDEAIKGMDAMHERGVRTVVVTSGVEGAQSGDTLACFASTYDKNTKEKRRYKFCFPRLEGQFVGTGDTFTSLLVVWLTELNGDVAQAVKRVLGSMQEILKKTSQFAQSQIDISSQAMCELRLVQSRLDLLIPPTNDAVKEDISFLERPGSPAPQNELNGLESDVIIPQAQNHDVGGRRIYPTRRSIQLQREQEESSLELASKIVEKDEILGEKRERPSNSPRDSSPEVEVVFQRHVESMKSTSKKEEKQTIEPRGNGPHQMDEPRNEDIEMVIILEKGKQDRKRCEDNNRLPVTIKRIRFDDQMEEKPNIMQGISSSQCTNIVRANTPFYNDK